MTRPVIATGLGRLDDAMGGGAPLPGLILWAQPSLDGRIFLADFCARVGRVRNFWLDPGAPTLAADLARIRAVAEGSAQTAIVDLLRDLETSGPFDAVASAVADVVLWVRPTELGVVVRCARSSAPAGEPLEILRMPWGFSVDGALPPCEHRGRPGEAACGRASVAHGRRSGYPTTPVCEACAKMLRAPRSGWIVTDAPAGGAR